MAAERAKRAAKELEKWQKKMEKNKDKTNEIRKVGTKGFAPVGASVADPQPPVSVSSDPPASSTFSAAPTATATAVAGTVFSHQYLSSIPSNTCATARFFELQALAAVILSCYIPLRLPLPAPSWIRHNCRRKL